MSLRKLFLRLMLASLAFSAIVGVLAVLTARERIVWRVVGTGLLAAVASGLMLVLSSLTDNAKSRPSGLLGMASIVIAFVLGILLIWNFGDLTIGLTLLLALGATPPLMFFLWAMFADRGKWAGIVGMACCGHGTALLLAAIWQEQIAVRNWTVAANLAASAWAVSAFGAIAAGSLVGLGIDRRWWRWIGITGSAIAFAIATFGIWEHPQSNGVPFAIVTGLAVIVAHANLAFLCNLRRNQEWVRWGTIGAVIATSLLLNLIVARGDFVGLNDFISRGAVAAAIAAGSGTLALLVLARLNRKITTRTLPTGVKDLAIVCPWCKHKQILPLGASSCAGCGLKFQIAIEEPHCSNCDYLLYMLNSDRCPECGTLVHAQAEAMRTAIGGGTVW